MEVSEVRRQLRQAIEYARRTSAERRARADAASRHYEAFLSNVATPVFRMFVSALGAEGYPFKVSTPGGGLQMTSERSSADLIELTLDGTQDPPVVMARTSRGRGRRVLETERPLKAETPVEDLREDDVLAFLLAAIQPFVER
jgi:hypothetical protein